MVKAELKDIRFDLPPLQDGGRNRVSYIEVLKPNGSIRRLAFSEPVKNTRTIKDELYAIRNGQEVLVREQTSCMDARTHTLESKTVEIFLSDETRFYQKKTFNEKGQPYQEFLTLSKDAEVRYGKRKVCDWETGVLLEYQEFFPQAPDGSVLFYDTKFDPKTGEVVDEQEWAKAKRDIIVDGIKKYPAEDVFLEKNSKKFMLPRTLVMKIKTTPILNVTNPDKVFLGNKR